MKRDMNLIRELLLRVEAEDRTHPPGYDKEKVLYHQNLLLEAELAKGAAARGGDRIQSVMLTSLTWNGHEFVDDIRSETIWGKLKKRLGDDASSTSLSVIKALAAALAKEALGLG